MLEETEVNTAWIKVPSNSPLTYVGPDTICVGRGCHFSFFNLTSGEESIYSATHFEDGDGIKCFTGNKILPVVAFAEKAINPRILIINYPEFKKLKIIPDGAPEGYTNMTFGGQEMLITLSAAPEYELIIWKWRLGERLYTAVSDMQMPDLILSCNVGNPVNIILYYENCTEFLKWKVLNSYKDCVCIKYNIKIPNKDKIVGCTWNKDRIAFLLNPLGCIYKLTLDNRVEIIIYGGVSFGIQRPCFDYFKNGFLVMLTTSEIKYFEKENDKWYEAWFIPSVKLNRIISNGTKDVVIGWSPQAELMEFDNQKHCFNNRKKYNTTSEIFCLIYPKCDYFMSLNVDNCSSLTIWDCLTGIEIAELNLKGIITILASNPIYPYAAAGFNNGTVVLVNCYNPENPTILTTFHLNREQITKICYADSGDIFVTASMLKGSFFVIHGKPGEEMKILHYIDYRRPALDICVEETERFIHLYILLQTDICLGIGNKVVVKSISKTSNHIKKKRYSCPLYNYTNLTLYKNYFMAKIFNSKTICTIYFTKKSIKILKTCNTAHVLKSFVFRQDKSFMYTFGYDGLIIVRDKEFENVLVAFITHHRYNGGVKNVIIDPHLRFVISYGAKSQELVCSKIVGHEEINKGTQKQINQLMVKMKHRFTRDAVTIGFEPIGQTYETYLEYTNYLKIKNETEKFAAERKAIMEEFTVLKKELLTLFNHNINGPELEKIDIIDFYQFTLLRRHLEEINKHKCEWTVKFSNETIRAQDEIRQMILENFCDTMSVISTNIAGVFTRSSVEGYSVARDEEKVSPLALMAEMYRDLENEIRDSDIFIPWVPQRLQIIKKIIKTPPNIPLTSESTRILELVEQEDELEVSKSCRDVQNRGSYPSSNVKNYFPIRSLLYYQEEIHTAEQLLFQMKLIDQDHHNLRLAFNKIYNIMKDQKLKEMKCLAEKNDRLRFILQEMNIPKVKIIEPKWQFAEHLTDIFEVKPSEIKITPYISPSEQARLDAEATEAERIRLLLLADNFREKALIKMMDGVLEVHWEDTLKRTIPLPKCMKENKDKDFTEDELRAIKEYEKAVEFLQSERLIYRNMLEQEFNKLSEQNRETIRKFNSRVRELLLKKIRIETARVQEGFIVNKLQHETIKQMSMREDMENMVQEIAKNKEQIENIQQSCNELQQAIQDAKADVDAVNAKDKIIDKNFKKDFLQYSTLVQEISKKIFKKQPKVVLKGFTIVTLLNEMSAYCISGETSPLLTKECLAYIRSIDVLDEHVGVPDSIDETMYKTICKHRRFRLANELKLKSATAHLYNIEFASQLFQKRLNQLNDKAEKQQESLLKLRNEIKECIENKQLQIVITKGRVETPCTGSIDDFNSSILIHVQDVELTNERILKAGQRKLEAIKNKIDHSRDIIMKEWEHKKLQMTIEDLKERLHEVDTFAVSKDVYHYLNQKAEDKTFDKSTLTYDQEIELQKKLYQKTMTDREIEINKLDKEIEKYKIKNKYIDQKIAKININLWELKNNFNVEFDKKSKIDCQKRMQAIKQRCELVKQIQDQHSQIAILQAELLLAKMKHYPSLTFDIINYPT